MCSWILAFVIIIAKSVLCNERRILRMGAVFEEGDDWGRLAFKAAIKVVNQDDSLLPEIELVPQIASPVSRFAAFDVQEKVCSLVRTGVVGIVGPHSSVTSNHVQSLCDTMEIPHLSARWDPQQRRSSCLVNLFPHPAVLAKASADIVRTWKWEGFTLLYDDFDALRRMGDMLKIADDKGYFISVRQLKGGPGNENNYRHVLQEVKHSEEKNLAVEVSREKLHDVLLQMQQVGLVGTDYNYIITSLDLHTIDLDSFKWAGTNITGLRLVDTQSLLYREIMELMLNIKREEESNFKNNDEDEVRDDTIGK